MDNVLRVSEALSEWAINVAKSVLPKVQIPPTSTIGGFMRMLGVDISTYSIYDELGFIIQPTIKHYVEPMVSKLLSGMNDEDVKTMAMAYADAFRKQAAERGYVNLFGIQLGESAFIGLQEILTNKLG